MDVPELVNISFQGAFFIFVICVLADFVLGVISAIANHSFDAGYLPTWLISHGKWWASIVLLLILGHGVDALQVPPLHAAMDLALGGIAAYVVATIKSLADSVGSMSQANGLRETRPPSLPLGPKAA